MTTPRNTRGRRLKAAGWVRVEGWLPEGRNAEIALGWIKRHAAEAERIATAPGRPGPKPKGKDHAAD